MINRGDIYWMDFGEVVSNTPAKSRPVVVISVDEANHTAIGTVLTSLFTSNVESIRHNYTVFVPKEVSHLPADSVIKLTELETVDKDDLRDYVGTLPIEYMLQIDKELKEVLGL